MNDFPVDPFGEFGELAAQLWQTYTGATAALIDAGFTEEQAREIAYVSLVAGISGSAS